MSIKQKQLKKSDQKIVVSFKKRTATTLLIAFIILLAGYVLLQVFYVPPLRVASTAEREQQKIAIKAFGFQVRATNCYEGNDNLTHEQRVQAFDTYFKINKYANRAVIRGCNDSDILIAKTKQGTWEEVFSLQLDLRQNPIWQKACLIDDITQADTEIRPENSSIDTYNLSACNYLRKHQEIMNPWEY